MNKEKKYKGVIVPAVTPLTDDYKLDEAAVEKIFNRLYQSGASPFILGTTGESASLTVEVKKSYVKKAVQQKQKGAILYAGISSTCLSDSIDFANFCFDNGVDAVVATIPFYYTLTESEVKKYFLSLVNEIVAPLVIYNIPATTHMSIPLELIDELSHHPHIVAIKDSERDEERLKQSLALWKGRADFSHLTGWAAKSADALINGSDGLVPSTGNLVPEIYAEMIAAVEEPDFPKAYEMQQLSDAYGNLYQGTRTLGESLYALKMLLHEAGLCKPIVMPPLQPKSYATNSRQ